MLYRTFESARNLPQEPMQRPIDFLNFFNDLIESPAKTTLRCIFVRSGISCEIDPGVKGLSSLGLGLPPVSPSETDPLFELARPVRVPTRSGRGGALSAIWGITGTSWRPEASSVIEGPMGMEQGQSGPARAARTRGPGWGYPTANGRQIVNTVILRREHRHLMPVRDESLNEGPAEIPQVPGGIDRDENLHAIDILKPGTLIVL